MAEILFNLAAEILKSLGSLATEEVESIYGLRYELKNLSATVSSIQAVLIDAEEQQGTSNLVRDWIKRLKKVFFEADDLLDDVATEVKHRKLFNKENFEKTLWVCVSDVFEMKIIGEKIAESGGGKKDNYLQLDAVQNELRKMLDGKKYLLVLDDVWNEDPLKWSILKNMLIGGAKGSKILLTTHSFLVAEVSGSAHEHKLGDLSEEEAWILFEKMAFVCNKESKNSNLVEIGKEIVRKDGGVPLAISNTDNVEDVANSYFTDLLRRSFFQETEEYESFMQFYKMHDLIHDLAKEVADRDFFSITKTEDTQVVPEQTLYSSCLFKIDGSSAFPNSFYRKHMKFRAFIFLHQSPINVLSNSTLERMISSFSRLRVLHLGHLKIEFPSQSLGGLKHLRYPCIFSWSISTLPYSITKLHNLQVLKLDDCEELHNLQLKSLMHLDLDACSSPEDLPPGIGHLTSLRTLISFILGKETCTSGQASDKLNELKGLVDVRNSLSVKFMGRVRAIGEKTQMGVAKRSSAVGSFASYLFDYSVHEDRANQFYLAIRKYYPGLKDGSLEPGYAGIKPKLFGPEECPTDFVVQAVVRSQGDVVLIPGGRFKGTRSRPSSVFQFRSAADIEKMTMPPHHTNYNAQTDEVRSTHGMRTTKQSSDSGDVGSISTTSEVTRVDKVKCVELAAYQLKDIASQWYNEWENAKRESAEPTVWGECVETFLDWFFPDRDMDFARLSVHMQQVEKKKNKVAESREKDRLAKRAKIANQSHNQPYSGNWGNKWPKRKNSDNAHPEASTPKPRPLHDQRPFYTQSNSGGRMQDTHSVMLLARFFPHCCICGRNNLGKCYFERKFFFPVSKQDTFKETALLLEPAVEWEGHSLAPRGKFISYLSSRRLISKGCFYYLILFKDFNAESPPFPSVPVKNKFPEVFLDDLPGIPPDREIDFGVDLLPDNCRTESVERTASRSSRERLYPS
ncbi:hypothetical protein CQW23_30030 [Capsicum baccatum]|uniref:NB-ARC domain-containing protein n=1 Tax=Capsicum baccatum TaxID=33114 RepID=A0A2G2VBL9_CAPBA|nr:hypothetical protein CQW23_30030 [Capsicum baccatum]